MMQDTKQYVILSAKGATGVGNYINVQDYKSAIVSFATDGGGDAALTVKFCGAIYDGATAGSPPDMSAAQSVTNMWDYIQVLDLQDGSTINGDDGISVATADDYRQLVINTDKLLWLNARVTARTQGEVTVKIILFNNA